jgi:DNA-binding response OmpR family regulator
VEDDLDAVQSMATQIKNMGHECRFAISSLTALGIARDFRPDLILLDMAMREFDGEAMAPRLRALAGVDTARVIALASHGDEGLCARARQAGCDGACTLPLDAAALEAILRRPAHRR